MFRDSESICPNSACRGKKKLKNHPLASGARKDIIGWAHINALIRFFYKVNPNELSLDERVNMEAELIWLSQNGMLPVKFE